MKKTGLKARSIFSLTVLVLIFTLLGCDKGEKGRDTLSLNNDTSFAKNGVPAICIWEIALREKPDAGSKWLTNLVPGLPVNYLKRTDNGPGWKDKNGLWVHSEWFYLEAPDGTVGWGLAGGVAENALPAVITAETATYQMPKDLARNTTKLMTMDTLGILEEKDGWAKVIKIADGDKTKQYWIKPIALSKTEVDFAVAQQYVKEAALYQKKADKKVYINNLKDILKSGTGSIFTANIEEELSKLEAAEAGGSSTSEPANTLPETSENTATANP